MNFTPCWKKPPFKQIQEKPFPPVFFECPYNLYHSNSLFRICSWLDKILTWSMTKFSTVPSKSHWPHWKNMTELYMLIPTIYYTLLNSDFLLQLSLWLSRLSDTLSLGVNIYEMYLCSLTHVNSSITMYFVRVPVLMSAISRLYIFIWMTCRGILSTSHIAHFCPDRSRHQ